MEKSGDRVGFEGRINTFQIVLLKGKCIKMRNKVISLNNLGLAN